MPSEKNTVTTNVLPPSLEDIQAAFDRPSRLASQHSGGDDHSLDEVLGEAGTTSAIKNEDNEGNDSRGADPPDRARSQAADVEPAQEPSSAPNDDDDKLKRRKRDILITAIAMILILLSVALAFDVRITVVGLMVINLFMVLADERVQSILWW